MSSFRREGQSLAPAKRMMRPAPQPLADTTHAVGHGLRSERETSRIPLTSAARSASATKIPQTTTSRQPSRPSEVSSRRPPLSHQNSSWNSMNSLASSRSGSAASSYTTTPHEASLRTTRNPQQRPANLTVENVSAATKTSFDSRRTSSSTSVPRSQSSLDGSSSLHLDRGLTASPTEIRVAQKLDLAGSTTTAQTVTIYPELDRYRDVQLPSPSIQNSVELPHKLATHDLPPPTPLFSGNSSQLSAFSGSPSTRWSGSPGPGAFSRDTTPTSASSQSPGLIAPLRYQVQRTRQGSFGRAGANDMSNEAGDVSANPHTLTAICESLNSSSSSSNGTIRGGVKREATPKKKLEPVPPSPPPRKSSHKLQKSRDEMTSPTKQPRDTASRATGSTSASKAATANAQSRIVTSPRVPVPPRPSRDGTPDLQSQLGLPVPIIHSNLSSTSLTERRTSAIMGMSSPPLKRSNTPSSQSDRPQQPSRLPTSREPTPAPRPDARKNSTTESTGTIRTPSPGVSTFKTRFPLFSRKPKTPLEPVEKKEKTLRKGPAAGTGHEGYGRLGATHARRRSSINTNVGRGVNGTMSSQENLASPKFQDPFLMDRVNPVVIAGGEVVENRNTSSELSRTESNQSLFAGPPSVESRNASQVSLSSREGRTTLWPSAFPRDTSRGPSLGGRRPSDSSDSEALAMKSTLAYRRSVQRLQSTEQAQQRLPKPIMIRPPQPLTSPSINSLDAALMSDDSVLDPTANTVVASKEAPAAPKKLTKRPKSPRKWNFFSRSQAQTSSNKKVAASSAPVAAKVEVVQVKPDAKPVAFYTMMDMSEQEDGDMPDVKAVLREAQVLDAPGPAFIRQHQRRPSDMSVASAKEAPTKQLMVPPVTQARRPSLPHQTSAPAAPALKTTVAASITAKTDEDGSAPGGRRPSRLQQVGRIPKVVSARPEHTSPKSFSRPFHRVSIQMPPPPPKSLDSDFIAKGPSLPDTSTPDLTQEGSTLTDGTGDSSSHDRNSGEMMPDLGTAANEFLAFSPRKGSQSTSCTTSSSSGILSFADATAVIPKTNAPLVEDEIWDEYNDLLEDDGAKMPPSARSSHGDPFHLESFGQKSMLQDAYPPLESPTISFHPSNALDKSIEAMMAKKPLVPSSIYSEEAADEVREALEADNGLHIPIAASESVLGFYEPEKLPEVAMQPSHPPQRNSNSSKRSRGKARLSDASSCSQLSDDNSPLSQVNLRVGSMTVSKWLTFGHVLFSPARDEIIPAVGSLKRHSILVVDGLGNDDWSFYAAETYPAATFFNLSPRAPLPTDRRSSAAFPLSPPNHHQIQYKSHKDKFPFAPESFTTVVFRFPAVAPESHYRNIVTEARRVLKPGGYLELSILDLDLNNMGNRTRRSVRRLREQIHAQSADNCLGSTADAIVRLLGTQGYSDVKSCRVGVPVASAITRSVKPAETGASAPASASTKGKKIKDTRSLAEMMNDESAVADESITKMVAKVGRWWYTRCYESAISGTTATTTSPSSIWSDRMVLAECEEWGTSLKLMVCHARVPDIRRVASI